MSALQRLRVVNTRARTQAAELDQLLRDAGAIPLSYPCIAIAPVTEIEKFDRILQTRSFDWICLTSTNAVEMLAARVRHLGFDRTRTTAPRYAVVGPATAAALKRRLGIDASFMPSTFDGDTLMKNVPIEPGARVLLPVSDLASDEPIETLEQRGAEITRMTVYQNTIGAGGVNLGALLQRHVVDAVTFSSPSAVSGFVARLAEEHVDLDKLSRIPIACIGPHTRSRAHAAGLARAFCPDTYTLPGLLTALSDVISSSRKGEPPWEQP